MGGRDGLLLVEPPDVQLVDRFNAGDLGSISIFSVIRASMFLPKSNKRTCSRSCFTSSISTPRGALSRRMAPEFLVSGIELMKIIMAMNMLAAGSA